MRLAPHLREVFVGKPKGLSWHELPSKRKKSTFYDLVKEVTAYPTKQCVAWSSGNLIAYTPFDGVYSERGIASPIFIVNADSPQFVCSVPTSHRTGITQLEWSQDGVYLMSCDSYNLVQIWRIKDYAINRWKCDQSFGIESVVLCKWLEPQIQYAFKTPKKSYTTLRAKFSKPGYKLSDTSLGNRVLLAVCSKGRIECRCKLPLEMKWSSFSTQIPHHELTVSAVDIIITKATHAKLAIVSGQAPRIKISHVCIYDVFIDCNAKTISCKLHSRIPINTYQPIPTPEPIQTRVAHVSFHYQNPAVLFLVTSGKKTTLERWEMQNNVAVLDPVFNAMPQRRVNKWVNTKSETLEDSHAIPNETRDAPFMKNVPDRFPLSISCHPFDYVLLTFLDGHVEARDIRSLSLASSYTTLAEQINNLLKPGSGSSVRKEGGAGLDTAEPEIPNDLPISAVDDLDDIFLEFYDNDLKQKPEKRPFPGEFERDTKRLHTYSPAVEVHPLMSETPMIPFCLCISPNGLCIVTLTLSTQIQVLLLPFTRIRADGLTSPGRDITDMFELSLVKNTDWWDILLFLQGLADYGEYRSVYKDVIILIQKDWKKLTTQDKDLNRPRIEAFKSAIYRSSKNMRVNYWNSQTRLYLMLIYDSLTSTVNDPIKLEAILKSKITDNFGAKRQVDLWPKPSLDSLDGLADWFSVFGLLLIKEVGGFLNRLNKRPNATSPITRRDTPTNNHGASMNVTSPMLRNTPDGISPGYWNGNSTSPNYFDGTSPQHVSPDLMTPTGLQDYGEVDAQSHNRRAINYETEPKSFEEYFSIADDGAHEFGLSLLFEEHTSTLMVDILHIIFSYYSQKHGEPTKNTTHVFNKRVGRPHALFAALMEPIKQLNTRYASGAVAYSLQSIARRLPNMKPIVFSRTLLITTLNLCPQERHRILESNFVDDIGPVTDDISRPDVKLDPLEASVPPEFYHAESESKLKCVKDEKDCISHKKIGEAKIVKQCTRCNRYALPFERSQTGEDWRKTWCSICPICGGRWRLVRSEQED